MTYDDLVPKNLTLVEEEALRALLDRVDLAFSRALGLQPVSDAWVRVPGSPGEQRRREAVTTPNELLRLARDAHRVRVELVARRVRWAAIADAEVDLL